MAGGTSKVVQVKNILLNLKLGKIISSGSSELIKVFMFTVHVFTILLSHLPMYKRDIF